MTSIAIIYFSATGHAHLMAEAIAAGSQKTADTTVSLLRITGEQIVSQHSMIWVGTGEMTQPNGVNRLGSYLGLMGQTTPDYSGAKGAELDGGDRLSCELYGQRIAESTARWNR